MSLLGGPWEVVGLVREAPRVLLLLLLLLRRGRGAPPVLNQWTLAHVHVERKTRKRHCGSLPRGVVGAPTDQLGHGSGGGKDNFFRTAAAAAAAAVLLLQICTSNY